MNTSPDFNTLPDFYKKYVNQVKDLDVLEALHSSNSKTTTLLQSLPEDIGEYKYAPEKWSIKEVICHMMDAERIFAYRALRFSRKDATPLTGFEENDYAIQANAHGRSLKKLLLEANNIRVTTIDLFSSFTAEMLQRKGSANGNLISVVNLGYVIAGHETHHRNIVAERYLTK